VVEEISNRARDDEPAIGLGRFDGGRHCESAGGGWLVVGVCFVSRRSWEDLLLDVGRAEARARGGAAGGRIGAAGKTPDRGYVSYFSGTASSRPGVRGVHDRMLRFPLLGIGVLLFRSGMGIAARSNLGWDFHTINIVYSASRLCHRGHFLART
jgi:hypothetical protein